MSFKNDINSENKLELLNESKKDLDNQNNSLISQTKTTFSSKEFKLGEEISISDFQEVIKPVPICLFPSFGYNNLWEKLYMNDFNIYLDCIKLNSNKSIPNPKPISFIGKKRKLNNKELLFKKNKNAKEEKAEEDFNINKSAFRKIEQNDSFNKSAFNKKVTYIKMTSVNQNKIKKNLENKIIINEINNQEYLENYNNIKQKQAKKLFKSTKFFKIKKEDYTNYSNAEEKKRGRKPKDEVGKKRVHNANDDDNILRKLQVHYLSYIISFTNDLVENFSPNNKALKFKNLSYALKKTVNHAYVEELKKKNIGDILQFQASSKNRKSDEDVNKQIYDKICNLFPFFNDFFNMKYLELFNQYYFKSNKKISFGGKIINLSEKTKAFSDLLEKNKEANEKIQNIAFHNFIENENKKSIFIIKK